MRSGDGRGALFWAYEFGNEAAVQVLLDAGCDPDARDINNVMPRDMEVTKRPDPLDDDDDDDDADIEEDDDLLYDDEDDE